MPRKLLQRVWFGCYHKFSWPRRSDDGNYYQICLECGVRYKYDWRMMRRTSRLDETDAAPTTIARKPARNSGGNNSWRPRERRLRTESVVQFRAKGRREWSPGQAQNISRSGLMFTAEEPLPLVESAIEVALVMPAEICGEAPAEVLCQGRVVRVSEAGRRQPARIAVAIADFAYVPQSKLG